MHCTLYMNVNMSGDATKNPMVYCDYNMDVAVTKKIKNNKKIQYILPVRGLDTPDCPNLIL